MNPYYTVPLSPPASASYQNWGLLPVVGSRENYPLVRARCHYHLFDTGLRAHLTHTFVSESSQQSDVAYQFPLPPDSSVYAFTATIDNRRLQGVIRDREAARAEYEIAVSYGENAALLQQENVEIFKMSLGNIAPGQKVEVQISFVQTITHEGGLSDSLRLNFPTTIAPRYGTPPDGNTYRSSVVPGSRSTLEFSLSLEMTGPITAVASPSHPVSVTIGRLSPEDDAPFEGRCAHVGLSTPTLLDKDVVITVGCEGLDRARCVVESYRPLESAEEWTDAYLLTFVPRFKLPELPSQEYIFLVDRSGSMGSGTGKMEAVRSALQIMLKSLPTSGTTFNIISFGSKQSRLWAGSSPYTADTVKVASQHIDKMIADHGGTEMKQALEYAFATRQGHEPATMFVLTDGQSYDLEGVRDTIREHVDRSKGHLSFLRVFCMGIGNAVSKAMCDTIARSGNGTAVYVGEKEKPDHKLMGLLRAASGPPIDDLELDWGLPNNPEDSSDDDGFSIVSSDSSFSLPSAGSPLSLYDPNFTESHASHSSSQATGPGNNPFLPPPVPRIQQAPRARSLPSLFPGFRSTFYAIIRRSRLGRDVPARSVRITGSIIGRPVALEVPVLPAIENQHQDKMIHKLAARAIVQTFEELPAPRSFVDNAQVRRIGLKYELVTSQTSFVAVDQSGHKFGVDFRFQHEEEPVHVFSGTGFGGSLHYAQPTIALAGMERASRMKANAPRLTASPRSSLVLDRMPPGSGLNTSQQYTQGNIVSSPVEDTHQFSYKPRGSSSRPGSISNQSKPSQDQQQQQRRASSWQSSQTSITGSIRGGSTSSGSPSYGMRMPESEPHNASGSSARSSLSYSSRSFRKRSADSDGDGVSPVVPTSDTMPFSQPKPDPPTASVETFAREQLFDGSFAKSEALVQMLFTNAKLPELPDAIASLPATIEQKDNIWITLLSLAYLDTNFAADRPVWEMMAYKAHNWLTQVLKTHTNNEDDIETRMKMLERAAQETFLATPS